MRTHRERFKCAHNDKVIALGAGVEPARPGWAVSCQPTAVGLTEPPQRM